MMPLSYFIVGELLCLVRLLVYFSCTQLILPVVRLMIFILSIFFFCNFRSSLPEEEISRSF